MKKVFFFISTNVCFSFLSSISIAEIERGTMYVVGPFCSTGIEVIGPSCREKKPSYHLSKCSCVQPQIVPIPSLSAPEKF